MTPMKIGILGMGLSPDGLRALAGCLAGSPTLAEMLDPALRKQVAECAFVDLPDLVKKRHLPPDCRMPGRSMAARFLRRLERRGRQLHQPRAIPEVLHAVGDRVRTDRPEETAAPIVLGWWALIWAQTDPGAQRDYWALSPFRAELARRPPANRTEAAKWLRT